MQKLLLCFLLLLLPCQPKFLLDEETTSIVCRENFYKDEDQVNDALDQINLQLFDAYFFVVVSPIALISTLFIIITFIKYPKMREPPGDILLGISLSEFVLTIHWMLFGATRISYEKPVKTKEIFCTANAIFSMCAGIFEYLYNCAFCFYLIFKIRNVLKGGSLKQKYFHFVCVGINMVVVIGLIVGKNLGKNLFGTCSIKGVSVLPIFGPIVFITYVFLSIGTMIFFKKKVPNDEKFKKFREDFLNYYYKYIRACCIIWSVIALSNVILMGECMSLSRESKQKWIKVVISIGNVFKLFTPVVLSVIRYQDPFLKDRVSRFFRKIKRSVSKKKTGLTQVFKDQNELDNPPDSINMYDSIEINNNEQNWLTDLTSEMKIMTTYSFISGILLNYNNVKDQLKMSVTDAHQDFSKAIKYRLDNENLMKFLPEVAAQIISKDYQAFSMSMLSHAPECFEELLQMDRDLIDLNDSLDLDKNYEQIKNASGADGGKGGEFFFFSYDNRIVLKTLTNQDFAIMVSILGDYYRYLKKHPDSFIAKIYGIYTFTNEKTQFTTRIILMRNISAVPQKYILKTYDLKGSTYDRQVLKKGISAENVEGKTLKDLDFNSIEKKLEINEEYREKIIKILGQDSKFFMEKGLIDYSLIVFKIKKDNYFEEHKINSEDFFLHKKELYSLKALNEKGIYYHIGIIDYLQPYDLQKFLEKNAKKLLTLKFGLDTSSQPPKAYQKRFMEYMKKII